MPHRRKNETYTTYDIETIKVLKPEYADEPRLIHRLPWGGAFEAYETRSSYVLHPVKGIGVSIKGNRVDVIHIPSGRILASFNKRLTPDISSLLLAIEKTLKPLDWLMEYDDIQDKEHRRSLRFMKKQIEKEYENSLYFLPSEL